MVRVCVMEMICLLLLGLRKLICGKWVCRCSLKLGMLLMMCLFFG